MAKLKLILILAVVILNSNCEAATGLASINHIGQTLKDIVSTIGKVVSTFRKHHPPVTVQKNFTRYQLLENLPSVNLTELPSQNIQMERTVRRMMNHVRKMTNKIPKYTESITDTLDSMLEMVIVKLKIQKDAFRTLDEVLEKIHRHSAAIDRFYVDFIKFSQPKLKVAPSTIKEMVTSIFSYKENKLIMSVGGLKGYFEPKEGAFMYEMFFKYFNPKFQALTFDRICDSTLSLQEEIKMIYNLVMVQELRAFMMTVFSYKYEELIQPENNKYALNLLITHSLERMSKYLLAIKEITEGASRERVRCDPPQYDLDINYFRLDYLFGLYYLNERQVTTACVHKMTPLLTDKSEEFNTFPYQQKSSYEPRTFKNNVIYSPATKWNNFDKMHQKSDIEPTTIIRNKVQCLDETLYSENLLVPKYCPTDNNRCNGILHHCNVVPSASFCEADKSYGRRYHWINNGTNDTSSLNCDGSFVDTMIVATCNSLLCQCSEQGAESSAIRTVSLMPQVADIEHNMVMTNFRFQKKDKVVHLQIQQGHLLPEGKIDNSTISWVPLPDLVNYRNVPEGSFWLRKDSGVSPLVYDVDYTFLKHDRMTLNLDDVVAGPGFVVTGVRLNYRTEDPANQTTPLELQVHITPYDYYQGHLKPTRSNPSRWINIQNSGEHSGAYQRFRREVDLSKSDDPLKSPKNNINISSQNLFVNFQMTDYEKDFGQLTVPYFDSRAAGVASLSAVSGAGIIHRGQKGYGGFLAPKLINVDHARFIDFDLSQQQIEHFTSF
ncbi:uncharacterized protein LOC123266874 [Cotesia glomerata]|uniref:Uncharacterized protein n=1 Tax=Cotesia glomerata TaxID=32391 RepID=A0AAV7HRT0_COTGL|nr:uncharacterized protein LOC123266874 [Cotesia glomerata]KAH0534356.1 hypothetical protein KQX54_003306 [Cotesia glomerata]